MTMFQILAWIIITIVCFILAPFMTIGVIFIGADMPILGYIFILFGFIHMMARTIKILER
jgi:hypothetical protein